MKLKELVDTVDETFENTSSYKVIISKSKELINFFGSNCDIQEIKYRQIMNYRKYLLRKGNAKGTINSKLSYLSKILEEACKMEVIAYKPSIPFYRIPKPNDKYYDRTTVYFMLRWARKHREKELQKVILIAFYTGLRINNILSYSEMKIEDDVFSVYDKKTKSYFLLPIHRKIRYLTKRFKGFDSNYSHIYYVFSKMKKDLGIEEEGTIHTFRHTFCTTLYLKGVDIGTIQKLANHKQLQNTIRYTHVNIEKCKIAINMI